ncbi:hypothetical protein ACOMHN_020349 [Nucella lapillus]
MVCMYVLNRSYCQSISQLAIYAAREKRRNRREKARIEVDRTRMKTLNMATGPAKVFCAVLFFGTVFMLMSPKVESADVKESTRDSDDAELYTAKRQAPMFVGKRHEDSRRWEPPLFVGKRDKGTWRWTAPPPMFVGKRHEDSGRWEPPFFVGKRHEDSRRWEPPLFVGKRDPNAQQ